MSAFAIWRKVLAYGLLGALVLQLGLTKLPGLGLSHAKAADKSIYLTEINWGGSKEGQKDQWVEVLNVGPEAYDFATEMDLVINQIPAGGSSYVQEKVVVDPDHGVFKQWDGETLKVVTEPSLEAGQYLMIRNDLSSTVSLEMPDVLQFFPTTQFEIESNSETPAYYDLISVIEGEDTVLDTTMANVESYPPFAGTDYDSLTEIVQSMARKYNPETHNPIVDGTDQASWYSAGVVGGNILSTIETQFGTPGAENREFTLAGFPEITPAYSTTSDLAVTVSGKVSLKNAATNPGYTVTVIATKQGPPTKVTKIEAGLGLHANFKVELKLDPGTYVFVVMVGDEMSNLNPELVLAKSGEIEDHYVVIAKSATEVPAPVLTTVPPTYTTSDQAFVSGTVAPGVTNVDIIRNGRYAGQLAVTEGTFSADLKLFLNQENRFGFIAVMPVGEGGTANSAVSTPVYTAVNQDNVAPLAVDLTKVKLSSNAPGTADTVLGLAGAAEPGTLLDLYADEALTNKINQSPILIPADGSFPVQSLGDNRVAKVYFQLTDMVGLKSPVVSLANPINFVLTGNLNLRILALSETGATVTWTAIPDAKNYVYKYAQSGSAYSALNKACVDGAAACATQISLQSLQANTAYTVAVAAIDAYGNQTAFEEYSFRTTAPAVSTAPVVTTVAATTKSTVKSTPTNPTTTTVLPSPTPTPTPEAGEVKSTTATEENNRNWTPWIILIVLVLIAAIATVGYFYWFGGTAGDEALAAIETGRVAGILAKDKNQDDEEFDQEEKPKPDKPKPTLNKGGGGKDKRW